MEILVYASEGNIMPLNCPYNGCNVLETCTSYSYTCSQDIG